MHNFNELEGATAASSFVLGSAKNSFSIMIDKQLLTQTVEEAIANTDAFLVDVRISPSNEIVVEIDSPTGVDIDTCAGITRKIESVFDRDVEDYELEVGSAGLTAPFKVRGQYLKNIGNEVEVLAADGRKYRGLLREAGPETFTVVCEEKRKPEGAKRPVVEKVERIFAYGDVKYTKYLLQF